MHNKDFKARISAIIRGANPEAEDAGIYYRPPKKPASIVHKRGDHWKQLARVERKQRA